MTKYQNRTTVPKIFLRNIATLFNLINALLALGVILAGYPNHALFIGVALSNTAMGIVQEWRAKRTLDKLSVLGRSKVRLVRDGRLAEYEPEDIVMDDILLLSAGEQIPVDAVVLRSEGLEADESLLTGESDSIRKKPGDGVLSGSFAVAGRGTVQVAAVGANSYAGALSREAKKEKRRITPLMRALRTIIRVLTVAIIPLGALLFVSQYQRTGDLPRSFLGMTTGVVGMIPEGLIILTTITLTVGALRLSRKKALVQALPCIETLARVDMLCLDKTGTITDGTLSFEALQPWGDGDAETAAKAAGALMYVLGDDNTTAAALRKVFVPPMGEDWRAVAKMPFSSQRKWSGAAFASGQAFVLGAPDILMKNRDEALIAAAREIGAEGRRVLCLAACSHLPEDGGLPPDLQGLALLVLSDTVRAEAADTFRFFAQEGVGLKVISGDDAVTASAVAVKAGIPGAELYFDMSTAAADADYGALAVRYNVFGRVTPMQKRDLIQAMQAAGHTTCMTGDGVNDVLAMKEAGCSVAMVGGSGAARSAADFILMTSDFSAMIEVLQEGRRVINNIENVASLYLVKTIFSTLMTLFYSFLPYPVPYSTLHVMPGNALTVGLPSFLLALRPNRRKPRGRLMANILQNSLPAALAVIAGVLFYQAVSPFFGLSAGELSTLCGLHIGGVMLVLLWRVSRPRTALVSGLLLLLIAAFLMCYTVFGGFFEHVNPLSRLAALWLPMVGAGLAVFEGLSRVMNRLQRTDNE